MTFLRSSSSRLRPVSLVAGLITCIGLVAACGGDQNDVQTDGDVTTTTAAAEADTASTEPSVADADENDTGSADADENDTDSGDSGDSGESNDSEQGGGDDQGQQDEPEQDPGQAGGGDLVERLTVALQVLDSDEVKVDEADARCAAEDLQPKLNSSAFEALVVAIEADRDLAEDDPITDADIRTITESFVACIDFAALTAELAEDLGDDGELVACLRSAAGDDFVTTELVYQLLLDDRVSLDAPLLIEGLASCPDETRPLVISLALNDLDAASQVAAGDCLAALPTETLSEIVDGTLGPNPDYEAFVERNCPDA